VGGPMRLVFSIILFISLAVIGPSIKAQSVDKIIDQYKKASGGKAVKRIRNTLMSGSAKSSDGATGSFSFQSESPNRLRIDIEISNARISECFNGNSAWRQDSRGLQTLIGDSSKNIRLYSLLANTRLHDLSRHRIITKSEGTIKVDDRDAAVIDFSLSGVHSKLFFDLVTKLPIKMERETSEGRLETFYSDYRKVDGVMEPFSIRLKGVNNELIVSLDRVEHNTKIGEEAFRYPKPESNISLPDIETLLKTVVANQEKLEELRERYTFRQTEVENELDGKGKIKKTETKVYDVTPVARSFAQRLISVDGKELTGSEREKEDRRYKKEVDELIKNREKKKKERAERKEKDDSDDENITILDFLRITNVTSLRREEFRGHEVIAFDFEPRKDYKPKNRVETIITKLAGTFFVDPEAKQIVRLEARVTDSIKFIGGLASLSPSSNVIFEQEKIREEVWLPSYAEVNLSAKAFFFAKFNRYSIIRYSDYKKYQTDVELKFEDIEKKD
jgi:hypothetical protein